MIGGLPDDAEARVLIERAFAQWAPAADVTLTAMKPGHSGSHLFKADVKRAEGSSLRSGEYVLKLSRFSQWDDAKPEFDAHARAYLRDKDFSDKHIPKLMASYAADPDHRAGTDYAMAYEIAGGSLDRYAPTDSRQDGRFQVSAGEILATLLKHWSDADVGDQLTAAELLSCLCGYRLSPEKAPEFHAFTAERIRTLQFAVGDHVLLHPLKFIELAKERAFGASAIINGLMHGDLHGGNILLNVMRPTEKPFYVIDFALSRDGPVGYDAAYLELAHVLSALGDHDPVLILSALHAVEEGDARTSVPGEAHWTKDVIVRLRTALDDWRAHEHPYRRDQIDRQFSLCRVAAGINWANKPIKASWRWAALCYAGWAARQYLRVHEAKVWTSLSEGVEQPRALSHGDDDLWRELWAATNGFDANQSKFVLVAEGLDGDELRALGQLPWSAVIDLDPKSDQSGLYHHVAPVLGKRRGVHLFGATIPNADPRRGTGWMMAGGWSAKNEYFPDPTAWRWQRGAVIREFVRRLAEATSPEPLHVFVLPGATLDPSAPGARIGSIVAAVDEASKGRAIIHLLGHRRIAETASQLSQVPMEAKEFVRRVAGSFGTGFSADIAEVPGPDRIGRAINLDVLRAMEENLHVLHSSILEDQRAPTGPESDFWRGRPPNWSELHAGLDIQRGIHAELVRTLVEKLEAHRNQTVILEHYPGAGGTTAALRAAWELRSRFPVAVLHSFSPSLADRVRELFQIAEQPILLVAEASDLTESAREDLYRYLARNNCRVVLLYLRRTMAEVSREAIHMPAPMGEEEAGSFLDIYRDLTADLGRKKQLDQLTRRQSFEKYRFPFYYGLITFERDFIGVDRFVESHVTNVGKAVRDVLEHLALVTVFSNGDLPLSLLKAMMDIDQQSALTLEDIVGPDPARLLVERPSGVRFMHWTIANKVLTHFRGGADDEWRLDLKSYAIDFIRSSVTAAGSEAMRSLFKQMFINRVGGPEEDDREDFAPIIESLDAIDVTLGHSVLEALAEACPEESHVWAHLGRHQVYRLKRDYDKAEVYLRRAVSLNQTDPLHHHTFGVVLRSQLRHRLKHLNRGATVDEVFECLNPLFEQAAGGFTEARRLSPDNVYGYITHIQMILLAAKELKKAGAVETVALVGEGRPHIEAWLDENLASAEDLLREATNLYAALDRTDHYLTQCEADLDSLYGDLDAVVELWEVANASGLGGGRRRRALANAYLARRGRQWSALDQSELQRVTNLMEQNLREAGRRDEDYELWFNAYMLLPDFDVDDALAQLSVWAKQFPSWRAYYYAYVLHFLLWLERRTDDLNLFELALDECKKRHLGRRSYSPLWYGVSKGNLRLVSEADLGRWKNDFFSNTAALRRVNGRIDVISGPQAGTIKIENKVKAFFVPGKAFSANRNENHPVSYYLGFNPGGLRAWSVQPGRDGVDRSEATVAPAGSQTVNVLEPKVEPSAKDERVATLKKERGLRFVAALVAAKRRVGAEISQVDIEHHLDALIGQTGSATDLSIDVANLIRVSKSESAGAGRVDLRAPRTKADARLVGRVIMYDAAKKFGFIRGEDAKDYWFPRDYILPGERPALAGAGTLVRFVPSSNERGGVAQGIGVLRTGVFTPDGLIDDPETPAAVSAFVVDKMRKYPKGLKLSQLVRQVEEVFWATGGIETRLVDGSISRFIRAIGDLDISGKSADALVLLADETLFGPPAKQPKAPRQDQSEDKTKVKAAPRPAGAAPSKPLEASKKSTSFAVPDKTEMRSVLVEAIRKSQARKKKLTLAQAGAILNEAYPGEPKLHARLGFKQFRQLVLHVGNISIGPAPHGYLTLEAPDPPSARKNPKNPKSK